MYNLLMNCSIVMEEAFSVISNHQSSVPNKHTGGQLWELLTYKSSYHWSKREYYTNMIKWLQVITTEVVEIDIPGKLPVPT